jgi:hypothetical protein
MRLLVPTAALLLATLPGPAAADTIIVDHAGSGDYTTIQQGINAASEGDTVIVKDGTYTGVNNTNLDFGGASILLQAENQFGAIIDCQHTDNTRAFSFHSGEDTTSVVEWFRIENGAHVNGGGVSCVSGSSPIFQSCVLSGNEALDGGAVYADDASPIFRSCDFVGNLALQGGQGGGGAYATNSSIRFRFCYFEDNDCGMGGYGGGIHLADLPGLTEGPVIQYSGFTGCGVQNFGGAIYCKDIAPFIVKCSFWDNGAPFGGGGICCDGASPAIQNCTIVRSNSLGNGSGIYCGQIEAAGPSFPTITNTIVAFGLGGTGLACGFSDNPTITHCVVFGNAGGDDLCGNHSDNIFYDPLFCDAGANDFTLCEDSQCLPGNNPWSELVGANWSGCPPCDDPVEEATWGSIKAMYR